MKYTIFCLILFILFSSLIAEDNNIALKKQIIGTIRDFKAVNDGIIDKDNYIEFKDFKKYDQYFIIVLGQAKYISSIILYWHEKYLPKAYTIEVSKNLFTWTQVGKYKVKKKNIKKGLIKAVHSVKNKAAFFVRVKINDPQNKVVRISEVQLLTKKDIKLHINDVKVKNISKNSADIIFFTTMPATGYLRFGESEKSMNQNIGMEMDIFTEHKIQARSLLKGTRYYFQPVVRDLNGNLIIGNVGSFKTRGIPLPKFLATYTSEINVFDAVFKINLNVPCKIEVLMGTKEKNLKKYFKSKSLKISCDLKVKKLIPETKFYYQINAVDKFNNKVSFKGFFNTKSDNIALNKKAYGSFNFPYNARGNKFNLKYLKKMIDGDYEVTGIAASGNVEQKAQVAIIDLKKKYNLRNIKVVWRGISFSRNFNVAIGNDMKKWQKVKEKIDSKKEGVRVLSKGTFGLFLKSVDIPLPNKPVRYIKVEVPKGSKIGSDLPFKPSPYLQLAEIEVYKIQNYGSPKYEIKLIK